jgi:predicted ATP-dependent Lon-type protease
VGERRYSLYAKPRISLGPRRGSGTSSCSSTRFGVLERDFSLGSHLKSRDVKAVRKTVSGLVKLIYPNEELAKEEVAELVELSLEGRRRVKKQLKKIGSFEFHQTSFSLFDNETREEKFVGVPEQGGRDMISLDPLAPGSVYTSSVDDHAKALSLRGVPINACFLFIATISFSLAE